MSVGCRVRDAFAMTRESPSTASERLGTVAIGGALLAGVTLAAVLLNGRVPPLDTWILAHLYSRPGTAWAGVATAISGAGTLVAVAVSLAAVGGLLWRRHDRAAGLLARHGVVLSACLATVLLQAVFQRSGPSVSGQDWTYPSGHVTVLTALGFTTLMVCRSLTARWRAVAAGGMASMLLLVAASRVTLGEHFLVDVVAALLATVGAGLLAAVPLGLLPARPADSGETRDL